MDKIKLFRIFMILSYIAGILILINYKKLGYISWPLALIAIVSGIWFNIYLKKEFGMKTPKNLKEVNENLEVLEKIGYWKIVILPLKIFAVFVILIGLLILIFDKLSWFNFGVFMLGILLFVAFHFLSKMMAKSRFKIKK